ncbi:MAG TPA: hypothetical protein VNJ08_10415 [Bacteriovoracaceae bacterium]|nr:hypothetical protein [Bacteriovoracaceae bacterium]
MPAIFPSERYIKVLKSVTPSIREFTQYSLEVESFIHDYEMQLLLFNPNKEEVPLKKFKLIKSKIFNKKYLVATCCPDWYRDIAGTYDAVSTPSLNILGLDSPPLVIIPETSASLKSKKFLAIMEHEFVHLNQALKGQYPKTDFSRAQSKVFMDILRAEYQAYFIQYNFYPASLNEMNKKVNDLEEFSIFRGLIEAIERLTHSIYQRQLPQNQVQKNLRQLHENLHLEFRKIGLPVRLGKSYASKLPPYIGAATIQLMTRPLGPKGKVGFHNLQRWILETSNLDMC